MKKTVMLILVGKRRESILSVQNILTEEGCFIKTRLGIHDGVLEGCADTGFIILDLVNDMQEHRKLAEKLNTIEAVKAKLVEIEI